jgi:hypothetical protein
MLVPACIAQIIAVHYHATKANDTCFHTHIPTASAWSHAGRVEENGFLTLKRTLRNVATKKSNRHQLQSCGTPQNATPT